MLVGQQIGRQAGEALITFGAEEALCPVLLFLDTSVFGCLALTWAAAMPMNFATTQGTLAEGICSWYILWRCS